MSDHNNYATRKKRNNGIMIHKGWQYDTAPIKPKKQIECPKHNALAVYLYLAGGGVITIQPPVGDAQTYSVYDIGVETDEFLNRH